MPSTIVECGNITIETSSGGTWLRLFDESGAEQNLAVEPDELILIRECINRWEAKLNEAEKV